MNEDQNAAMNEKTTQMLCSSPFIVKLHETFNEYFNQNLALKLRGCEP